MELPYDFFRTLRLVKYFYDSPLCERMKGELDGLAMGDEDAFWEFVLQAIDWPFERVVADYNEDFESEILIFFDPLIDRFARLCQEYEEKNGLDEEHDPYRQQGETEISYHLGQISGYDYNFGWRLSTKDHGRRRIVFRYSPEFCFLEELPIALMEIRLSLEDVTQQLEQALRVIPLPVQPEWKEAA